MTKISIAIPTWETNGRGDEFLDDLLRTIEIQTFRDFDVVISDHSENDLILSKVQEFDTKFKIKYIKNTEKRGCGPANTNSAIKNCDGDIIKIMFQDDFFYDDEALEKIYYTLSDSDKHWLLNGTNHTSDHGYSFYWDLYPRYNENLLNGVNTISSPSVVSFKKSARQNFDENLVYLMDTDYYHTMYALYGDPIYYDDILVTNRVHSDSISSNIVDKNLITKNESEYCMKKHGVSK